MKNSASNRLFCRAIKYNRSNDISYRYKRGCRKKENPLQFDQNHTRKYRSYIYHIFVYVHIIIYIYIYSYICKEVVYIHVMCTYILCVYI